MTACAGCTSRPGELAAYWTDRIERLLRAAVRDVHLIPAGQRVDVEFGGFMADDLAMAVTILDTAGLGVTDRARAELTTYLAGNPRDKEGRMVYDLRGDFGLEPDDLYRAVRLLLRRLPPGDQGGGVIVAGIHRQRPGADAIAATRGEPAVDLGDGIWMSPGLSNSYLLQTDDGRIIVNTGMGFEGPLHRRAFDAVDDAPTRAIILTQGHFDHVGGVDCLRDEGTDVIAQADFARWRDDNERLETFRSRNAAFAWMHAIVAAIEYAESLGAGGVAQARPEPTVTFEDRLEVTIGGRELVLLSTPGGETTDSLIIWMEDSRTALDRQPVRRPFRARPQSGHHAG